jgi:hypothetical protein
MTSAIGEDAVEAFLAQGNELGALRGLAHSAG